MPKINLFEFGDWLELPFTEEDLKDFKQYLQEIWENRQLFSAFENENVSQQKIFNFQAKKIQARNYVGYIRFKDWEFQLFPKIFNTGQSVDFQLVNEHLFYYLSYSQSIYLPFAWANWETMQTDDFLEIWLFLWLSFIEQSLLNEPYRTFEAKIEENTYLKGRLATQTYINQSLNKGNWQNLYLEHEPFEWNNQFNQLLKYVCKSLLNSSKKPIIEEKLANILNLLGEIEDKYFNFQLTNQLKINYLKENENLILNFCQIILLNEQINEQKENGTNDFSLLIPMERVFEELIYGFMQKHFPEYLVKYQKINYLAQSGQTNKKVFQLRNDIYLPQQNLIIDTKYKIREFPFADDKTGVESADMYQMLTYGVVGNCKNIVLLYPASFGEENLSRKRSEFKIQGGLLGEEVIKIKAVDIGISQTNAQNLWQNLDEYLKTQLQIIVNEGLNEFNTKK